MNGITCDYLISICIPTFNRGRLLDFVLDKIISNLNNESIEIVVCDNASTDETQDVVKKHLSMNNFKYIRQDTNVGFDNNVIASIENSSGEYCWLLGDSAIIDFSKINDLLLRLSSLDLDAYIINVATRIAYIESSIKYTNINKLIVELGWHCTQMPALILKRSLLSDISYNRYIGSGFIHFGILFESLASKNKPAVFFDVNDFFKKIPLNLKSNSWYPEKAWPIFMKSWPDTVFSLPLKYSVENKLRCIEDHNLHTKIFSLKSVIFQRANCSFDFLFYRKYFSYIKYANNSMIFKVLLLIIALIPTSLLRIYKK